MRFITFLKHQKIVFYSLFGALFLTSCGSYHYVGMSDDGIYGSYENGDYVEVINDDNAENVQGNSYYEDYFKGKATEYSDDNSSVFTDVDDYSGDYNNTENTSEKSYAGWGQNNDAQVVINIQTRPLNYGLGWGYPFYSNRWGWNNWGWNVGWNNWGWNNWGWNVGWNNWGWNWGYQNFGFWDPYFYSAWQSPYGYAGNFYNNPYGRRYGTYINGYRNTGSRNLGYRSGSLSSRSALGTVSRTRSTATRSANSSRNSYNTTRSTTTRSVRNNNGTRTTTRTTRTTTQPTRSVRSSTRTTSPTTRTTTRSTRSSTRTTRPTYTRPTSRPSSTMRSSGGTTRSRGGGITSRRRN